MAITRYSGLQSPWKEFDILNDRLSRFFPEFAESTHGGSWLPPVNVEETEDEVILSAELPGLSEDDVEIQLENNILTISGEKVTATEGEGRKRHLWERRFGSFRRAFTVPRTVNADDIAADFDRGVLTVRMPKAAEARSRRIEIRSKT